MLVDQVEWIPSEKNALIEGLSLSVCCEGFVHKVADIKLNSWSETFFLHPGTTVPCEGQLFATHGFKLVH